MDKNFDDLFNEFIKRFRQLSKNNNINNDIDDLKKRSDDLNALINKMNDFTGLRFDDNVDDEADLVLGKPDRIEFYNEDDLFFEKRIWHTKNGDFVKLIITDEPTLTVNPKKEKPLQEQLDEAIENEDFEKACEIRDIINLNKKEVKIRKSKGKKIKK